MDSSLNKTLIEGVELSVCQKCSKFGKVLLPAKERFSQQYTHQPKDKKEKNEVLIEGYGSIIKSKRESRGLSQKEFANKVNEKESIIHKIETGTLEPRIMLAKKLERFLGIKLVEDEEEEDIPMKKSKITSFTLGDFINFDKK